MQQPIEHKEVTQLVKSWTTLNNIPSSEHDDIFLQILDKHGFKSLTLSVPLKYRYTKGRRWSDKEFDICYKAWEEGCSLTLIAAHLNRNPQDIIYKLLDRCKEEQIIFTQQGRTENIENWTFDVKKCAEELFENGLPAWKIAAIFRVEFEYVEKELFVKRKGYGHEKKNPFSINTDHKQLVNKKIIDQINSSELNVLEAFAGEGRFTKILQGSSAIRSITCIENDEDTFNKLQNNVGDNKVTLLKSDNLEIFHNGSLGRFDIIDLDPFVTCHKQLNFVWNHLKEDSYLFITFGGEYRRSFIKTNRQSIANRYNFLDMVSDNSKYLEIVPYYFLGSVAKLASENNFTFNVIRAVRYANNCRYWLKISRSENAKLWFNEATIQDGKGIYFKDFEIPRFKEIRKEIDLVRDIGVLI